MAVASARSCSVGPQARVGGGVGEGEAEGEAEGEGVAELEGDQRHRSHRSRPSRAHGPATAHEAARICVSGMPESIVMSSSEGVAPAETTAEPRAAIIAPLSVQ